MVRKEITHSLQECLLASVVQYGGSFYLLDRTVTTKNTCKNYAVIHEYKKGDADDRWRYYVTLVDRPPASFSKYQNLVY